MGLYKILIVDDEEEIRQGIVKKINWAKIGFCVVGDAGNGEEALELFEKLRPDVVMTDIKMPFMDGLTFGGKVMRRKPDTKLIVFSGFDDFELAKQAIQIGVAEYILKPINAEELTVLLSRLKVELDNELDEKRNMKKLYAHYMDSLPILREKFLVGLVEGRIAQERIYEQALSYNIDVSAQHWTVALLYSDSNSLQRQANSSFATEESQLIILSLKQIADENIGRCCRFKSFIYSDFVAVIAMLDTKDQILDFVHVINQICKISKRVLEISTSAGIGSAYNKITNLPYSYQDARNALDYRVLMGANKAIYIDDVEPDRGLQFPMDEQDEQELFRAIKLGTADSITAVMNKLVNRLKVSGIQLQQYQIFLMGLMTELLKVVRSYQINTEEIFGVGFDYFTCLSNFDSLDALNIWFSDICIKVSGLIRRERMDSAKMIAEKTKQYINEHYSDSSLSVEVMCSYLHVSPAYFSTIFKRETNMSFINYLTHVRMEEAIRLLNTTEKKNYIISAEVGYLEPNYFSYVFKKHFGVSPSKYKSNRTMNDAN